MDVYSMIAERIITELEQGIIPWHKPKSGSNGAISYTTGKLLQSAQSDPVGRSQRRIPHLPPGSERGRSCS